MNGYNCKSCGRYIPEGGLFYISRIEIVSGFDGVIPEPTEDPDTVISSFLKEFQGRQRDRETEKALENEVYEKIELLLCDRCRNKLRNCINLMTSP